MPPTTSLPALLADLADEQADLDALVASLEERRWDAPTPATGWTVRDQVGHLAHFDDMARFAVEDPERFAGRAQAAVEAATGGRDPMAEHLERGRAMTGAEVLSWWREARTGFLGAASGLRAGDRVPWYGPPMIPL